MSSLINSNQSQSIIDKAKNWFSGYEYKYGGKGTDTNGNDIPEIDCSHMVYSTLQKMGSPISYEYVQTKALNSGAANKYFGEITSYGDVIPGDLIVFNGHVGIVESIYFDTTINKYRGTFFHSEGYSGGTTTTGFVLDPGSNRPGYQDNYYGDNIPVTKFLRLKSEFLPEGSGSGIGFFDKIIDSILSKIRSLFNIGATVISPIILDLDKDGVETTALTSGTYFDHDANGFSEQTGWASSDDGLLVLDRDADGLIENGTELFGNNTLLADGTNASNGFQALAELDTNADGKIDANDAAYSQLRVWQDYDEDGYTSEGELHGFRLLFSV